MYYDPIAQYMHNCIWNPDADNERDDRTLNIPLNFVGSYEINDAPFEFNLIGVWKNEKGFYIATDSGCSCPTPFENYGSLDDLTGPLTRTQCVEELYQLALYTPWNSDRVRYIRDNEEFGKLIDKVKETKMELVFNPTNGTAVIVQQTTPETSIMLPITLENDK